jgi:AcrR family transcriptional regulator
VPKSKQMAVSDETSDASIPTWKSQSVERSLKSARERAQDRSDRFVNAGIDLIRSTGDTGFTVQDVVDRSGMSIRTFYLFFATKDDLLVAIHETLLATEVEPRIRARCDSESDPVAKLRMFVDALFELSGTGLPSTRAFIVQQNRLAESRPDDLDRAMVPQVNLVTELLRNAAEAGRLRHGLDIDASAKLFHQLVLVIIEARVLGSHKLGELTPDQVWDFCSSAVGATLKTKSTSQRPARRP